MAKKRRTNRNGTKARVKKDKPAPKAPEKKGQRRVVLTPGAFDAAELHASRDKIMELRGMILEKNTTILKLQQAVVEKETQILAFEKQALGKQNEALRERHGLRLDATLHKDEATAEVFYMLDNDGTDDGTDDGTGDDEPDDDDSDDGEPGAGSGGQGDGAEPESQEAEEPVAASGKTG